MGLFYQYSGKYITSETTIKVQKQYLLGSLLIMVFFLLPMYIFPSGGYQLVDIPILFIFLWALSHRDEINEDILRQIKPLIPFVLWVCLINGINYILYPRDLWYLFSSAIIIYGFFILYFFSIIFISLLKKRKNLNFIYIALIMSIFGCFLVKGYSDEGRVILSFNNPNQLAYFAVILCSYGILLIELNNNHEKVLLYDIINILFIIISFVFGLISLSRAGIFALICFGFYLLARARLFKVNIIVLFMTSISFLYFYFFSTYIFQEKIEVRPKRQWSLSEMIYGRDGILDRIYEPMKSLNGIEIVAGKGAGLLKEREELQRGFGKSKMVMEVHNMFMGIFRNYGIIGFLLFISWFVRYFWNSLTLKSGGWVIMALIIYNIGHDGIRFRSFWILLAFLNAMIWLEKRRQENTAPELLKPRLPLRLTAQQAHPIP
ncbi:MAG: hypothetical protein WHT07_07995 [Desulfobaccales bacterium]